jgi:micrococcal nuclease
MKYFFLIAVIFATLVTKAQTKIDVNDAAKHMNETVTVCAKVYGVKELDKVTLINLGAKYPASPLTIAVFEKDRPAFANLGALNGKDVCVTGKIIDYNGKPEIIITKAEELTITEEKKGRE